MCLTLSVYNYCVTCFSYFFQLSPLAPLYVLHFSVFLLLFEYVKLDNSFYYQVLVEVCMFLIIFIFIIFSMFVCIMYFCRSYKKFVKIKNVCCNFLVASLFKRRNIEKSRKFKHFFLDLQTFIFKGS